MTLSLRGERHLRTLKRIHVPPVEAVRSALIARSCPIYPAWLEFHSSFGGYVEPLGGGDEAIYGLMRENGTWLNRLDAVHDAEGWRVMCADAHPSYDFWMNADGEMDCIGSGGPFESSATRIERNAVVDEVVRRGWKRFSTSAHRSASHVLAEAASMREFLVNEASDKYARTYLFEAKMIVARDGVISLAFAPG